MACKVLRNNDGSIREVLAPNNKRSNLFYDLLDLFNKMEHKALTSWKSVYTSAFKDKYGDWENGQSSLELDDNGEPKLVNGQFRTNRGEAISPILTPDINGFKEFINESNVQYQKVENSVESVNYMLKAVDILRSNKAKQVFEKGKKNNWDLNKILTELAIPKEQKELILDLDKINREDILTELLSRMSYTVEINTAKEISKYSKTNTTEGQFFYEGSTYEDRMWEGYFKNNIEISQQEFQKASKEYHSKRDTETQPTQHYSNLTVPGGTNGSYREQNFETPLIKVPKSHAQFNTENTIGFSRNDDRQIYTEKDVNSLLEIMQKSGILEIKC